MEKECVAWIFVDRLTFWILNPANANWCSAILNRTFDMCLSSQWLLHIAVVLELILSLRFVELLLLFHPLPPAVLQLPSQGPPSHCCPGHDAVASKMLCSPIIWKMHRICWGDHLTRLRLKGRRIMTFNDGWKTSKRRTHRYLDAFMWAAATSDENPAVLLS